jgi:asparagine synthase (glutamine-hydrolysing)
MCGIAAIFAYDSDAPNVDREELFRIRDRMISRGPDGAGAWFSPDGRVALGHRRLAIIDLSGSGAQPMWNTEGTLCVTFNGEIYNYRELRPALEVKGYRFRSTSDTEVLLHLYSEYGHAMVAHLRGMYAFAIWDERKKGLFLARDPMGIKPLYLADDGKSLRIASQVKALLAGGRIDTTEEAAGHVGFFLWGHVPEPFTLYRGIRSLPAGSVLWIARKRKPHQTQLSSVTDILEQAEKAQSARGANPQDSEGAISGPLGSALRDSIRHHLIADVPVGVFLSAGLDSTTLTALAAFQGGSLRTVTLGFEEFRDTPNDETRLAEQVARYYGARHQTVWVTRTDFFEHVAHLIDSMDQPTIDGVNTYFVSLAAARASMKVALSGLGGDELFGGYPSFREIPRAVQVFRHFGCCPQLGTGIRIISHPLLKRTTSPKYAGLFELGGTYSGAYLLRRGLFMPWELPEILQPEIVRQGFLDLQPLLRLEETLGRLTNPHLKVSCLETCCYMRNQLLRDSDWAGMAHSLEIRVPMVDAKLLKDLSMMMASATPPTKRDLANTPESVLPVEILSRRKTGFSIPIRDWLLAHPAELRSKHKNVGEPRGLRGWAQDVYRRMYGNCTRSSFT